MTDIDNSQDYLDVRDIIERVENLRENIDRDAEELASLELLLENMKGYGGDHQWEGEWYPVTLIRDSYFEDAMDELLEDIGELKAYEDRPPYIKITVDYDALQMDYTSVEFDGVTYWYR